MESLRIQELLSPRGRMSQLVFRRCWGSGEVVSNASEGMDWKQAKSKSFLLLCPYMVPAEPQDLG